MKRCELRSLQKLCVRCRTRKARVRQEGRVVWIRKNSLCFQCCRAAQDRLSPEALASAHVFQLPSSLGDFPHRAQIMPPHFNDGSISEQELLPEVPIIPSPIERRLYALER